MYDIDTALLRTFVVLAETRSFSKTAVRVGRSQSAISSQMKKLEELMGVALIERDTRNFALTPDGERLLGHAAQIVTSADALIRRFRSNDIEGSVRFGSPEDFASAYLPDILSEFAAVHQRVVLHVACDLTLRLIEQFEAGMHDLVIVKQDPSARHAGARPLWLEELVWVSSPTPVSPGPETFAALVEDLSARGRPLPLVLSPAPCVYRSRAIAALDMAQTPWSIVYESPSHAGCCAAVCAGLGFAVMPRALKPNGLQVLGSSWGWPKLPSAEMCLLPAARLSPAAAALARFIELHVPANRETPS